MKMYTFNEEIDKVIASIDNLPSENEALEAFTLFLRTFPLKYQYESNLLAIIHEMNPNQFTSLLIEFTNGPDQATHTEVRNVYFYMTANFGKGLFNSNAHLYQLVVSGNLFVVIPVLVGAAFWATYYAGRKLYLEYKQRKMSQFNYATEQFRAANPDLSEKEADALMTKQAVKGLLTYLKNSINAAEEALNKPKEKPAENNSAENFFARVRKSSVTKHVNSAWMTLGLVSMLSWIIFATGIITGAAIAFPISAGIIVGIVAIAIGFRIYKNYFSSEREKALERMKNPEAQNLEDLKHLLDPQEDIKARHQQRIKDFMTADFMGKSHVLTLKKKLHLDYGDKEEIEAEKLKSKSRQILKRISPDGDDQLVREAYKTIETIPALERLETAWWNKDSRVRAIVTAILGASGGFMAMSFMFAPLSNTVFAILAKVGVAATAATITALSIGVAAIIIAAGVGIYLGIYYHYARKQEVKENKEKLDSIRAKQNFALGDTNYENISKEQVMKNLLQERNILKYVIKSLQDRYGDRGLPNVNLPGYDNHTYFTEMKYERSLASKVDDAVQIGLAGLDGLGTGFFMPRANFVTSKDSVLIAAGIIGLTAAMAIFHPPLLLIFVLAGIMGTAFMVFKVLKTRYEQQERADQNFLNQFDTRLEYLQNEVNYLRQYQKALVEVVAIDEIKAEQKENSQPTIVKAPACKNDHRCELMPSPSKESVQEESDSETDAESETDTDNRGTAPIAANH